MVVGIDIYNLEAEAYGALVGTPEGNGIPAISAPGIVLKAKAFVQESTAHTKMEHDIQ